MEPVRIVLAGAWVSLMLVYLLGDVLRIFAGDHMPGEMDGQRVSGSMWTLAAVIMLIPIVMITLSLVLPATALQWTTTVLAAGLILFNAAGLPYAGFYDNLLIGVGFLLNAFAIWQVWAWPASYG